MGKLLQAARLVSLRDYSERCCHSQGRCQISALHTASLLLVRRRSLKLVSDFFSENYAVYRILNGQVQFSCQTCKGRKLLWGSLIEKEHDNSPKIVASILAFFCPRADTGGFTSLVIWLAGYDRRRRQEATQTVSAGTRRRLFPRDFSLALAGSGRLPPWKQ